jgi:alcohol dehydrogenase, propanol-preferring
VVVKVGSQVTSWNVGDRAGVKPTWDACIACRLCWDRLECHCPQAVPTGLKVPGKGSYPRLRSHLRQGLK